MIESTSTQENKEEIEQKYKSLKYVEKAFDEVKNLIEIRPVFHYKEKRIKGHILSCFMSYYLLHKFKTKISDLMKEYTLDTILTELECIKKTYYKIDKVYFEKLNNFTDLQKRLFDIF
jgi:transposase